MNLEECYARMDGDLAQALDVLETPERVRRYLARFAGDPTARLLFTSLQAERMQDALRAAHTLKGLARGLGMRRLSESCSLMTETLRRGGRGEALAQRVQSDYDAVLRAICEMEGAP